jgi:signal transduction histidine kinase/ligand-binding sensor domain-containing protein
MRGRHLVALGVLLTTLLAWSPGAHALDPSLQISQYAHTSWRVRDGAFAGSINTIAQTPDGYLWLGTEFGLVRFDGVRAVPWQLPVDNAFPAGAIVKLLTTRDGTLWIGGDPGLASLKAGKLTTYRELADQRVSALLEDDEGTVWIGSSGTPYGRLCAIQSAKIRCHGEDGAVGGVVAGLYGDRHGNLWAGVPNGLWRWKPGPPQFYGIPGHPSGVRPLGEDADGAILITWHRRIAPFVDGRIGSPWAPGNLPDDWTWRFLDDRDGVRWIAMQSRGLARVHRGRTELFAESDGLSGDAVRDLFEDREGNIWVATFGGLDRFRGLTVTTLTQKQGLATPLIWSLLAARDGSVWMGSGLGLTRWRNGQLERFGHQDGLLNGEGPGSLFEDRRGRIWVSTNREVGYLEGDRFIPVRTMPPGYVFSIVEDSAGDLWVMNQQRGALRLRGEAVQEFPWATLGRTDHATSAIADPRQGIWLGFEQGGVAHFADGKVGAVYSERDGLGAGEVLHFRFDSTRALWVATKGGLTRIKDASVATIGSKNGLPCDTVHWSIEDDAKAVWAFTACGLVRVDRAQLDAWIAAIGTGRQPTRIEVTVFDSSDGVRSNRAFHSYRPRVAKTADGRLWFLPIDGVSVVDPRRLGRNELPPPVYIERITADRAPYDAIQGLRLPSLVRDVEIDYTALSLVAPEKNRFRVMLEGRDTTWQDVGTRRQAFYTDLAPGSYRFRVSGSNNSGIWNEGGTALEFSITPAYYQTRWFQALVVVLAGVFVGAGYVLRVRQVARHYQQRLDERVHERLRIARELHDTLLQSFHGLLLRFQTVSHLLPERPAEAKAKLDAAVTAAADAITEGRDAVQGLRTSTIERNDLARAISTLGDELSSAASDRQPAAFRVAVEGRPRDLHPMVRDEIYKISAEALRNAFRHARPGRVEVEVHYDNEQFRLRVRDDGTGIAPEVLASRGTDGHYGLRGMSERAAQMGGKLAVWSERGTGTEVELRLPGAVVYAQAERRSWFSRLLVSRPPAQERDEGS